MNHQNQDSDDDLDGMPMVAVSLAGAAVLLIALCIAGVFLLPLMLP